ncbi:MAG: hypothetical protein AAF723_10135, partial [Pseudomonadota bacterium]
MNPSAGSSPAAMTAPGQAKPSSALSTSPSEDQLAWQMAFAQGSVPKAANDTKAQLLSSTASPSATETDLLGGLTTNNQTWQSLIPKGGTGADLITEEANLIQKGLIQKGETDLLPSDDLILGQHKNLQSEAPPITKTLGGKVHQPDLPFAIPPQGSAPTDKQPLSTAGTPSSSGEMTIAANKTISAGNVAGGPSLGHNQQKTPYGPPVPDTLTSSAVQKNDTAQGVGDGKTTSSSSSQHVPSPQTLSASPAASAEMTASAASKIASGGVATSGAAETILADATTATPDLISRGSETAPLTASVSPKSVSTATSLTPQQGIEAQQQIANAIKIRGNDQSISVRLDP